MYLIYALGMMVLAFFVGLQTSRRSDNMRSKIQTYKNMDSERPHDLAAGQVITKSTTQVTQVITKSATPVTPAITPAPVKVSEHPHEARDEGAHGHHVHEHQGLLFLLVALVIGALTNWIIDHYAPSIPFTVVLLVEGFVLGILQVVTKEGIPELSSSINMWYEIDPHLMLFVFLPALLFADCMTIQWHYFKRCFWQCLILAGPGVVVGTILTACYAKFAFPYSWNWPMALAFGSIMASTDPVAVVGILKSCGVSPKLTIVISGESLLNDGASVVLFNIFNAMMIGTKDALAAIGASDGVNGGVVLLYFLRMAFGGVALGALFGIAAAFAIGKASSKTSHGDSIVQFAITLCCAYLSFFVGEHLLGVSGVLACVVSGIFVGAFSSARFVDTEGLQHTWHMIEWVLNTLIFLLSGIMVGQVSAEGMQAEHALGPMDVLNMFLLYAISVVGGRFVMMGCFFPVLSRLGYGLTWKNAAVASWGGLRGAVGMALAFVVRHELGKDSIDGQRILFFACGMAALTLLINGMLTGLLLSKLGLTKTPEEREALFEGVKRSVHSHCKTALAGAMASRHEIGDAKQQEVAQTKVQDMLTSLNRAPVLSRSKTGITPTDAEVIYSREIFLRVVVAQLLSPQS
eukprot:gnl/MRDRNA2_/MRDRNA2_33566_c0_seq1.p1 gnl/MRDRNA2_/MRDRNA2_33566_c0~~gnl/MRDRNA2_/MRDRNA2_33566_c0_seq1.p1  ORF type:complete len:632 (-),score=76.78 gnl/MRDRNA2_/MRDRNA2_33566_c0_seq1:723-2618(-)